MKKIIFLVLLFFESFALAAPITINYMVIENVEPFQISDATNPLKGGLVTEIIIKIFKNSNYLINPIVAPWGRLDNMKNTGKLKNWIVYGGLPGKNENAELSKDEIFIWKNVLIVSKKKKFHYRRINDLFDKNLILIFGFDYPGLDNYLKSKNPKGRIDDGVRPQSVGSALQMLARGRGFGYVDVDFRLKYNMTKLRLNPSEFYFFDFSKVIKPAGIHLMFDKKMPTETKNFINQRLSELQRSGELATTIAKYQPLNLLQLQ